MNCSPAGTAGSEHPSYLSLCEQDTDCLPETEGAVLQLTFCFDLTVVEGQQQAVFLLWGIKIASPSLTKISNLNISPLSDPVFSDTCKIDAKFLSLNYLGSYIEPQESKGCVLSGPDKDREVHIIELQAPNSSR